MVRINPLVSIAASIVSIAAPANAGGGNRVILGSDPNLTDGATALSTGNYGEGSRTAGLRSPVDPLGHRARLRVATLE